ncbi:hypothetical protein BG841_11125 [Marinobacter sp. X15-166B]|nr:hypothetical protein BG841_11125 [Marinobacter sp. X15-166B]
MSGGQLFATEAGGPVGRECAVNGTGHRIFIDAHTRRKITTDKITVVPGGGNDHPLITQLPQGGNVGAGVLDLVFTGQHHHVVGVVRYIKAALRSVRETLADQPRRVHLGEGQVGKVQLQPVVLSAGDPQATTEGFETHGVHGKAQLMKQHPGRGQSGVAAQGHLGVGGEPANVEIRRAVVRLGDKKRGLGQVVLAGDLLQQRIWQPLRQWHDSGWVAAKKVVAEGVDLIDGQCGHGLYPWLPHLLSIAIGVNQRGFKR